MPDNIQPTRSTIPWRQAVTLVGLLIVSWCVMTFTHELGHIIGGWFGGATLTKADLAPWRLPYSLHSPDPKPLLTLWSGPLLGIVIPFLVHAVLRKRWTSFIANFCLLANGLYLTLGWLSGDRYLDTIQLLNHGCSPITLAAYCLTTITLGYTRFRHDIQARFSQ